MPFQMRKSFLKEANSEILTVFKQKSSVKQP